MRSRLLREARRRRPDEMERYLYPVDVGETSTAGERFVGTFYERTESSRISSNLRRATRSRRERICRPGYGRVPPTRFWRSESNPDPCGWERPEQEATALGPDHFHRQ